MTLRDRLFIDLRYLRSGLVGVLLVVFATAVGVALTASTNAFIRAYRQQTRTLLNNPAYREVRVEVLQFGDSSLSAPVVETDLKDTKGGFFTVADMIAAVDSSPAVDNAYLAERFEMVTTGSLVSQTGKPGAVTGKEAVNDGKSGEAASGKDGGDTSSGVRGEGGNIESEVIFDLPVDSFPTVQTTPGFFAAYEMDAAEGFLFTQADIDGGNLLIVLGSALAKTLFPDGGAVGSRVSLYYQTFTIAGILEPSSASDQADMMPYNEMAYAPQESLESAWGKRLAITDMRFTTSNSDDVRAAVSQLTSHFQSVHPTSDVAITDTVAELRKERQTLSRGISVLVFLSVVGLFVSAINLMNLMLIRTIKHTKGIGIMLALGTTRNEIFRLFSGESVLMCAAGAIIGAILSPWIYRLLQTAIMSGEGFASQTFGVDLIVGAGIGFMFSALFGLYPAFVAKNTNTTLALRAE